MLGTFCPHCRAAAKDLILNCGFDIQTFFKFYIYLNIHLTSTICQNMAEGECIQIYPNIASGKTE